MRHSVLWEAASSRPNCRLLIFTLELQQRSSSPSWRIPILDALFSFCKTHALIFIKNIWIRCTCVYLAASTFGRLWPVIRVLVISEFYERSSVNYFKAKVLVWATGRQPRLILTCPTGQTLLIYWAITCWFVVMMCFGGVLLSVGRGAEILSRGRELLYELVAVSSKNSAASTLRPTWEEGRLMRRVSELWCWEHLKGLSIRKRIPDVIKWDLIISSHFLLLPWKTQSFCCEHLFK